jgi:hypothetical protein
MAERIRGEGFRFVPVPEHGLVIPVPQGWSFRQGTAVSSPDPVFLATREPLASNNRAYITGLQVIVLDEVSQRTRYSSAEELLQLCLTDTSEKFSNPVSDLEFSRESDVVRAKRDFIATYIQGFANRQLAEGVEETIRLNPSHVSMMLASRLKTDSVFIMDFTTPQALWNEDRNIAKNMFENIRFSHPKKSLGY